MEINFLKYRKIYFIFSGILILGSIICLVIFGLNPGIDFTGGSILELEYDGPKPSIEEIRESLSWSGAIYPQPSGENGIIIRMKDIDEKTHRQILEVLGEGYQIKELRFESIGPVIGGELKQKTKVLIGVALVSIVLYIAFAFRRIQRPLRSWQYGVVSLFALFHDVLIPVGVFSILGEFYGVQITMPVVVALLTVLGYAINNVVVVFDRIRENLIKRVALTFEETVNKSLNQTFTRCINTALTTLLVLIAIFFFGGVTLKYFALALIIGITVGIYSSLFLVPPLLTIFRRYA